MFRNHLPEFIAEGFREKKYSDRGRASALFIDIVGFTSITEALISRGKEGSEILSDIINKIFSPSIN
ncbi:MAG TPA: hypothetical protein ENN73_03235, partial [Firmicutes bacterium]|nr:hypothetical protein [Bacillota bacterium]